MVCLAESEAHPGRRLGRRRTRGKTRPRLLQTFTTAWQEAQPLGWRVNSLTVPRLTPVWRASWRAASQRSAVDCQCLHSARGARLALSAGAESLSLPPPPLPRAWFVRKGLGPGLLWWASPAPGLLSCRPLSSNFAHFPTQTGWAREHLREPWRMKWSALPRRWTRWCRRRTR